MYHISELATSVGLSRATLLYYEKMGLLRGRRQANGYRVYDDRDRQRIVMLKRLQSAGLSLQECQACLDGKLDTRLLSDRLAALDTEIAEKTRARDMLAALLGQGSLKQWHEYFEHTAPDLHRAWLMAQGLSSTTAGQVAALSKDINTHDTYMAAFMQVFAGLNQWGPGTPSATKTAASMIPFQPKTILDIGCGPGPSTITLAQSTAAHILAADTDPIAIDMLTQRISDLGLADRITPCNYDMAKIPQPETPWDVIWAEGSAYIIGVETALDTWRPLLQPAGVLVFSDMVWRSNRPSNGLRTFWMSEYPAMTTVSKRLQQARSAGYDILGHFDMGTDAMNAYYDPLDRRITQMANALQDSRVLHDLQSELDAYRASDGMVGYEMFVLQKRDHTKIKRGQ